MKKLIGAFLLFLVVAYGALPVNVVWELRTTGNANSGGGFVTGSTGTDRSQSDTAFCTSGDFTLVTTSTATSVLCPFSAASVGNLIQITAGVNCTVGFYQVVSVATVTATLDRVAGTTGCVAGTFALGGAVTLPQPVCAALTSGNTVYMKATAAYVVTTSCIFSGATAANTATSFIGYTTTRGDNGKATWTTATNGTDLIQTSTIWGMNFSNFTFTSTAASKALGFNGQGGVLIVGLTTNNCSFDGFDVAIAVRLMTNGFFTNTEIKNSVGYGLRIGINTNSQGAGATLYNVWIHNNGGGGVEQSVTQGHVDIIASVIANNTGDGVQVLGPGGQTGEQMTVVVNSVIAGNSSDGIELNSATNEAMLTVSNSIIYGNTGFGVKANLAPSFQFARNVAYGANGTDRQNFNAGVGDVALSADPFVNSAGGNYALNSTVGGGTALKAVGFPGVSLFGTGSIDIGALQSSGGGSSGSVFGSVN